MSENPDDLDGMDDLIDIVFNKNKPARPQEPAEEPEKETRPAKPARKKRAPVQEINISKEDTKRFAIILDILTNNRKSRFFYDWQNSPKKLLSSIKEVIAFAEFAHIDYLKSTMTDIAVTLEIDPEIFRNFIDFKMLECKNASYSRARVTRITRLFFSSSSSIASPWQLFQELVHYGQGTDAFFVTVHDDTIDFEFNDLTENETTFFKKQAKIFNTSITRASRSLFRGKLSMCKWAKNYEVSELNNSYTGIADAMLAFYDETSPFHDAMIRIVQWQQSLSSNMRMEGTNVLMITGSSSNLDNEIDKIVNDIGDKYVIKRSSNFIMIMLPEADFTRTSPDHVLDPEEFIDVMKRIGREDLVKRALVLVDEKEWILKNVKLYSPGMAMMFRDPGSNKEAVLMYAEIPVDDSILFKCYEKMIDTIGTMPGIWFKPRVVFRYDSQLGDDREAKSKTKIDVIDHIVVWIKTGTLTSGISAVNALLPDGLGLYFSTSSRDDEDDPGALSSCVAFHVGIPGNEPWLPVK